jgi:hypothetical protein
MGIVEAHKELLRMALLPHRPPSPLPELDVLLVRVSRRPLDWGHGTRKRSLGGDNPSSALKAFRDGFSKWLGCTDDRDPRVSWWVGQRWGPPKYVGVEIFVARRADPARWWDLPDRFLRGEL